MISNIDHLIVGKIISISGLPSKIFGVVEDSFLPNEKEGKIRSLHK